METKSLKHELKKDEILYFLHIPKTAGTTLINILDDHFDIDSIYPDKDWTMLEQNRILDFSKYQLIRGHFEYGIHKILPEIQPKKIIYITMLRDPVEKTISFYEHVKREGSTNDLILKQFLPNNETLSDIKKTPVGAGFINNQVHSLTFDVGRPLIKFLKSSSEPMWQFFIERKSNFGNDRLSDEDLLKIAKERLHEFTFFGLADRFEESLFLLCYIFSWRPIPYIQSERIAPNRPHKEELSKEIIDGILECTKLDTELYSYAQKLFDTRFSQMLKELKEKYYEPKLSEMSPKQMIFELLERNYMEHFSKLNFPVNSIDFNFKQALNGSGWYPREYLPNGNIFRWTGPDKISTIDFALKNDSDLTIQFSVLGYLERDIIESLELIINETPISLKKIENKEKTLFEGHIPKMALQTKNSFTRIKFQVNRTVSPKSINHSSNDDRLLGFALECIQIFPFN